MKRIHGGSMMKTFTADKRPGAPVCEAGKAMIAVLRQNAGDSQSRNFV